MIKSIEFKNFRNLNVKYSFNNKFQVIFGNNNTGKTNILDGIRLAFSIFNDDYFRIKKSDFYNSDDTRNISIEVELENEDIPSLEYLDSNEDEKCGFIVTIYKTISMKYVKKIALPNGGFVDMDILRSDPKIPKIYTIPLIRFEDIYSDGLSTEMSNFITSESKYKELQSQSKAEIKKDMEQEINKFKDFCKKFNQDLDIEITEPQFSRQKAYVVDGDKEHNYCIGSGYKSIANIVLYTLNENSNLILIDEIENHLHPSLVRTLIREIRKLSNTSVIATTHSAVVINESSIDELVCSNGFSLSSLDNETKNKLDTFLHPGRAEIVFAENIILVEGYSEEIILNSYLRKRNNNWTIVNVAGIMFEPYIKLAKTLNKKIIVISDNDISLSENGEEKSQRFIKLKEICEEYNIKLIETYNTLESDLYNEGFINNYDEYLKPHEIHTNLMIAKQNKKTFIAKKIIEDEIDLSNWHVIKEIENEFRSN